jgi:hypothetical protein
MLTGKVHPRQARRHMLTGAGIILTSSASEKSVDLMKRTESAFSKLGGEYLARKKCAEGTVCDWKWASWCWFEIQPLYFERHGWAPGRALREAPAKLDGRVECGLDQMGRVTVERQYNELGFYETFYDWSAKPIEVAHFNYSRERKPINLLLVQMERDRAVTCFKSAIHGFTREEYKWVGSLVREVNVFHAKRAEGKLLPLHPWHTAKAHYDDAGLLQRVELVWPPAPPTRPEETVELMFERRGKRIYRKRT